MEWPAGSQRVCDGICVRSQGSCHTEAPPQLRACHFQEVERFTSNFNRFRANLMGRDDSHIARKREERDDSWNLMIVHHGVLTKSASP